MNPERELSKQKDAVVAALQKGNIGTFTVVGTELVGPTVGQELTSKGVWATVLSLVGILAYLAFRFQFSFGVGAVVATLHDLLITLAFLAFFRYDMTLNVIAAILTMTGYSTNDTIVIFDRIRENLRSMRRDSMRDVINASINQTLGRTVITAGTALLTSLALFFFGGEVLHGFAFTMVVGIITGTYSSVFIAAATVSFWRGQRAGPRRRARAGGVDAVAAPAAADAQGQSPRRPSAKRARRSAAAVIQAALLGVVQGVTEFLPVSSTAHLLIASRLLGFKDPGGVFTVMIQLGSIFAVRVALSREDPRRRDGSAVAARGAALRGDAAGGAGARARRGRAVVRICDARPVQRAGGERRDVRARRHRDPADRALSADADGARCRRRRRWARRSVSACARRWRSCRASRAPAPRSWAVSALGLDRAVATEFSFFLAIPTLTAAFANSLWKVRHDITSAQASEIAIGFVMAFVSSALVVRPFLNYVRRSGFQSFAWYRIVAGLVLLAALAAGWGR